jgi:hypothetical protein
MAYDVLRSRGESPCGTPVSGRLGSTYYLYGNTWFKPSYGANGVYYRVVPAP